MSFKQSTQAARQDPVLSADGQEPIVIFADYDLSKSGNGALSLNDIIEMLALPAGYVPVDCILDSPDLDSNGTPLVTLSVGLITGDWQDPAGSRTCGAEFISASTVGQAGGIARLAVAGGTKVAPTTNDRSVGIKVAAAPATSATTGVIRLSVTARPQLGAA